MKKKFGLKIQYIIAMVLTLLFIIAVVLFAKNTNIDTPSDESSVLDGTLYYGGIVFNELMLSNDGAFADPKGEFYDYCELYNTTSFTVDLEGYEIYNEKNQLSWVFPAGVTIAPEDYLILFFSGDNKGKNYVNMKLSKSGDQIFYLRNSEGNVIDRVQTFEVSQNSVIERRPDGVLCESSTISPGYANTAEGKALYLSSRTDMSHTVKISEVMAKNTVWIKDSYGDFSDYIEITNYGNETVNLENFTISNDPNNMYKWNFPSYDLKAGESFIVFASGKDKFRAGEELHLSFNLDIEGENLYLCREGGILIDSVSYTGLDSDSVYVRDPSSMVFSVSNYPSPCYPNTDSGVESFLKSFYADSSELVINEVMTFNDSYVVQNQGQYYDWIELKNNSNSEILLSNYYLATSVKNPKRQQLPAVILSPGEIFVVFASGEEKYSTDKYFHSNFKLNSELES
ncbi:MAG: lamin tail domain-containing protein, partial [Clostridia bacterium]|nr:lamin tail domain-containing protein [Clostridia bacterium]